MRLYNTLTRQKEEFKPITPGEVKMYSCGPTVYNYFHLGNARPFIVFDCLRQFLEYMGYKVKFVQNFTDVDDKLINKSREEGISVKEIAEKYIKEYFVDANGLGIKEASVHPRATENIDAIIESSSTKAMHMLKTVMCISVFNPTKITENSAISHLKTWSRAFVKSSMIRSIILWTSLFGKSVKQRTKSAGKVRGA